jgi:hypothetical protein
MKFSGCTRPGRRRAGQRAQHADVPLPGQHGVAVVMRDGVTEFRDVLERQLAAAADTCPWKGLVAYGGQPRRWPSMEKPLVNRGFTESG